MEGVARVVKVRETSSSRKRTAYFLCPSLLLAFADALTGEFLLPTTATFFLPPLTTFSFYADA